MGFGALALLAMKALMLSALALMLSLIVAMKKHHHKEEGHHVIYAQEVGHHRRRRRSISPMHQFRYLTYRAYVDLHSDLAKLR